MAGATWTAEEDDFIRRNFNLFGDAPSLLKALESELHTGRTLHALRIHARRLGLLRVKEEPYTQEMDAFILDHIHEHSYAELAEMVNARFGTSKGQYGMRSHCSKVLKCQTGQKQFQPGHASHNTREIGAERWINGYLWVKVGSERGKNGEHFAYRNNWKMKHRLVWEAAHGPIPENCQIIFLDQNRKNIALDNLYCISLHAVGIMRGNGWFSSDPEITMTAIRYCELMLAISKWIAPIDGCANGRCEENEQ